MWTRLIFGGKFGITADNSGPCRGLVYNSLLHLTLAGILDVEVCWTSPPFLEIASGETPILCRVVNMSY